MSERELAAYEREAAETYAREIGEHLTTEERRSRALRLAEGVTIWKVPGVVQQVDPFSEDAS